MTGLLRLLNTFIQAFPAILVSRLLRTIENSAPPSKSLTAAGMLVAILTLKMIVENLYFHKVVKMSTSIRGAVSGVIFDKSLRLPGGGGDSGAVVEGRSKLKKSKRKNKNKSLGVGGVLNLMQTDASMLESVALQIHTIWDGPLQVSTMVNRVFTTFQKKSLFHHSSQRHHIKPRIRSRFTQACFSNILAHLFSGGLVSFL